MGLGIGLANFCAKEIALIRPLYIIYERPATDAIIARLKILMAAISSISWMIVYKFMNECDVTRDDYYCDVKVTWLLRTGILDYVRAMMESDRTAWR